MDDVESWNVIECILNKFPSYLPSFVKSFVIVAIIYIYYLYYSI